MLRLSIAVFLAVVFTVTAIDKHQQELKQHYDHLAYIAEFSCQDPQPRIFSVNELFTEQETSIKAYFPDVTVLHVCDNYAGCCSSNHVCKPKQSSPVNLPFKVTFLEDVQGHKKGSWMMEYHRIDNHTECACQEVIPEDSCH